MKLQLATILIGLISSEARKVTGNTQKKKILSKSRKVSERKLDQNEDEFAFLQNYKMKMISCIPGETVRDQEGDYEMNAVLYRLCPSTGDCDDDKELGCKDGYGDYIVGLNTFVNAYMEEQRDNNQYDDNFKVDEYAECRQYENNNDDGNGYPYYIGPACTEDGTDIKLELFYDQYCTEVPEDITFEEISNGWKMPYSDGGLVSTYCTSCKDYNDNGYYEAKESCQNLYESSQAKCETNMEYYHYYGKSEGACEYIDALLPKARRHGSGFFFTMVLIGAFASYVYWWKKKKLASAAASAQLS